MMYIDAVCNGIDDIPTVDDETRTTMKRRLAEEGLEALVEELRQLDPEHYETVDRQNPRRVVHALEICHMTGKTYTSFRKAEKKQRPFDIIKIGLTRDREELYQRINQRVDQMMADGLLEEVKAMLPYKTVNALNTVGYKELIGAHHEPVGQELWKLTNDENDCYCVDDDVGLSVCYGTDRGRHGFHLRYQQRLHTSEGAGSCRHDCPA